MDFPYNGVQKLVNGILLKTRCHAEFAQKYMACVYLTYLYLHFDTQLLHITTMEDEKVASKCVQELGYRKGCGYTSE